MSDQDAPIPGAVYAVGTAVHSVVPGLSSRLEAVMVEAVIQAQAEGITDPQIIIDRKHAALDAYLATL